MRWATLATSCVLLSCAAPGDPAFRGWDGDLSFPADATAQRDHPAKDAAETLVGQPCGFVEKPCAGDFPLLCLDDALAPASAPCAEGCTPGKWCNECRPGALKCQAGDVWTCDDGFAWSFVEDCPASRPCEAGSCEVDPCENASDPCAGRACGVVCGETCGYCRWGVETCDDNGVCVPAP